MSRPKFPLNCISGRTGYLLLSGLLAGISTRPAISFGIGPKCIKSETSLRGQDQTGVSTSFVPNKKPFTGMSLSPKDVANQSPQTLNHFLIDSSKSIRSITLDSGAKDIAQRHLTIVMGNEASDLDSMASSVLLAYAGSLGFLDRYYPNLRNDSTVVPVMNIPRADYALRQVRTCAVAAFCDLSPARAQAHAR
jgi:hypothetical protein